MSIDPGTRHLAWALWDAPLLRECGLARAQDDSLGARIQSMLRQLVDKADGVDEVVCEMPRVYPDERKKRPNDLLDLAAVAGSCACLGPLVFVYPYQWKGQVPKGIMHERVRRQLSLGEVVVLDQCLKQVPKSLQHNVLDAVGVGQWRLKSWAKTGKSMFSLT